MIASHRNTPQKSKSSRTLDGNRRSRRSRSQSFSRHQRSRSRSLSPADDHPLNGVDRREQEGQDVVAGGKEVSSTGRTKLMKQSSLSSIAFKDKHEINRNISHARPGKSKTSTKKSTSTRRRVDTQAPSPCERDSSITDAEKTIIELKLELAQARSVIDKQAYKYDELSKQNRNLRRKIDRCETEAEINKISSENLEMQPTRLNSY